MERDLKGIIASLPCHVYWKDLNGVYLGCNDLQARSAGFSSREGIIGKTDYDMPWKKYANRLRKIDLKVMRTGKSEIIEEPSILADGTHAIFLSNKVPLKDEKGKIYGLLGISMDITFQKQYENELKVAQLESRIALENILNNVPAHIFWKDRNCILLGCNDLQAKNMGFSSGKEMIGTTNYDVISSNQPEEERKRQADAITKVDLEVINKGVTYTVEEPLVLQNGETAIYLSKKTPLRNDTGEIIGILGISIDITEQRKTEKALLETQHKLEGMTLISASTAHELRTPLASLNVGVSTLKNILPKLIETYQLAKEKKPLPVPFIKTELLNLLSEKLDSMQREIYGSQLFIDMLLMNLNPQIENPNIQIFSILTCIEEALARYPFVGNQRKLVHWQKEKSKDFQVKGEVLLITHLMFNLLKNALYYVVKAGKGEIQIWTERSSSANKLYFKDTGTGIPAALLPHIFDRFFSKTRHGAGIGLTFCKAVMENMGGSITCESVEGRYTLFTVSFPPSSG